MKQTTSTNFFTGTKPGKRSVINADATTTSNQKGIIKLYEELVQGDYARPINIKLIAEEGLKKFRETLGIEDYSRLMEYYGIDIGVKPGKHKRITSKDAKTLVDRIRTIENAASYIDGYYDILESMADLLYKAPEDMPVITKAKIVRMYHYVMCNRHVFLEDYDSIRTFGKISYDVTPVRMAEMDKRFIYPESLFYIWAAQFSRLNPDSIIYETIVRELLKLQKKYRKLMLEFAGLRMEQGMIISSNDERLYTYREIRNLKANVNCEVSVFPFEVFSSLDVMKKLHIPDMYYFYKYLKDKPITDFPEVYYKMKVVEGSRYIDKPIKLYEVIHDTYLAGENEKDRFIHLFDFAADEGIDFPIVFDSDGNVLPEDQRALVSVRWLRRITNLAKEMGLITEFTPVEYDFDAAVKLSEIIGNDRIGEFTDGIMTDDEAKALINSNKEVVEHLASLSREFTQIAEDEKAAAEAEAAEPEVEEPKKETSPLDIVERYARTKEYISEVPEGFEELVSSVLIEGNEEFIMGYESKDFDERFEKKLCLKSSYAPMFFNLECVDAKMLEDQLIEWKHSSNGKKQMAHNSSIIRLYCYIVENEVPCGPRKKKISRNKALKPQILRDLIA